MEKKSTQKKTQEEIEIVLDPKIQELYARLEEEQAQNARLQMELEELKAQREREQAVDTRKAVQRTRKKLALQDQLQEKKLQKEIIDSKQYQIDNLLNSLKDQKEIQELDSKSLHELKATLDSLFDSRNRRIELINKLTERNNDLMKENEHLKFVRTAFAHDLRSLMSSILGTITLLDIDEPELAAELLPSLEDRCRLFMNLLNAINADEVLKETFSIEAVTGNLNLQGEDGSLKATLAVTGQDIQLHADRAAIYDVIQNLVNNSMKYSQQPAAELRIKIDVSQDEEHTIILVADNGVGIPEDKRKRIFELYDRAGMDDGKGKGIGLYMARKMIANHDGTIEYDDGYTAGARFVIKLPPV